MADRWPEGEAIGGLLASVRAEHGKSQYTLAHDLAEVSRNPSVTRDYVSRWESGRRVPTPYWRQHLSAALGIPADFLDKAAATAKHNRAAVPPGTGPPSTPDHGDMLAR